MPDIPYLTTGQMREVDRAMIEDYHIELVQMMENAGRNLAHLARTLFLDGDPQGKQVVVLSGTGGNGGGGLVCARRLHNWGAKVHVFTTQADESYRGIPAHQLDVLRRMNVHVTPAEKIKRLPPMEVRHDPQTKKVKGNNQVKVTFILPEDPPYGKASVVGDFNNWDPTANPLVRRSNRTYSTSAVLEAGQRYAFRYLCEGEGWVNDEAADAYEPSGFGSDNCILLA